MTLATSTKVRIARWLYRGVRAVRALGLRRGTGLVCRRRGVTWDLDLRQGIDLSIYLFGGFERAVQKTFARWLRPGMVVLDIGANSGAHALPMAQRVAPGGRVYAIEATRWAFEKLTRNAELNPELSSVVVPVHAVFVAPGDEPPTERFASWSVEPELHVHPVHRGSPRGLEGAAAVTCDDFIAQSGLTSVDFVKLDVDGYELKVLRGARRMLARFRPPILLELCAHGLRDEATDPTELLAFLAEAGYGFRDQRGRQFRGEDVRGLIAGIPAGGSIDVLTVAE